MEPEIKPDLPDRPAEMSGEGLPEAMPPEMHEPAGPKWIFFGRDGLRAGWSVLIFTILLWVLLLAIGTVVNRFHVSEHGGMLTARGALVGELVAVLALLGAAAAVAAIEHRRMFDFNLIGPRRPVNFLAGLVAGFLALSLLVGTLDAGGWLHFGPVALSGLGIVKYAAVWGCMFFLVGCFEEGTFRCYLQFTLTRGINFWWALGSEAVICLLLALRTRGSGAWGVYAVALLGLAPCLMLQLRRSPSAGFWQAAWVTSTLFGFVHTGNNGENWIGIFAAAAIGFVFCVSIWVTGSAWWAIGCHAGWDWGETYFYGTADSGMVAQGHYLTTTPAGNALWSGGADGPEGSLLVLGVIALLLVALLAIYGRKRRLIANTAVAPAAD